VQPFGFGSVAPASAVAAGKPELGSLRARLAKMPPADVADVLWEALRESLSARKVIWATCGKCGKRTEVEVRDPIAATHAPAIVLEQFEGRRGVAAGDGSHEPGIVVKGVLVGLDGAPSTEDAERLGATP
jgi:hypothetical protein